ncbi:MAG: MarR family transcriptional regulator [Candidatus Neomarinimicrobiota bacterium]|nr:MAG: MarR family transcriptional regulator [Candidatus Neomarinimicrobiota bacterium]
MLLAQNGPHRIAENLHLLTQVLTDLTEDRLIARLFHPPISKTQLYLLKTLYVGGAKTISTLAQHFGISNAAISQSVEKLVHQSLVSRKTASGDRRSVQVSIRKKAVDLLDQFEAERITLHNRVLIEFSVEEQQQLNRFLERYIQGLVGQTSQLDIMCLQCNDLSAEECVIRDHNRYCVQRTVEADS